MSLAGDRKPGLIREISPDDGMFDPEYPEAYFEVGDSALHCIRCAMDAVGKSRLERILDFPCGHGRVLRTLKHAFPEAGLTASDVDRKGVDFCSQTFGARGVYSDQDLSQVKLEGEFDLIWVGSLFTHLPDPLWLAFLDFFVERLAPDGLLVFTTHGRWSAEQIRKDRSPLAGSREAQLQMLRAYEATGFGFVGSGADQSYGTSLTTPAAVLQRLEACEALRLLAYFERGWARHQDVVTCQKGFTTPG
jgi:SAM-dependent methyltransferase